jgi:hypothetical protein
MGKSIKEKLEEITESVGEKIDDVTKDQTHGMKSEFKDIEKMRHHKELVYYKTEALAIVIRKLGGFDAFLKVVEDLTREGYWMVNSEDVKNLLSNFGISLPGINRGTLYFFQNKKYLFNK